MSDFELMIPTYTSVQIDDKLQLSISDCSDQSGPTRCWTSQLKPEDMDLSVERRLPHLRFKTCEQPCPLGGTLSAMYEQCPIDDSVKQDGLLKHWKLGWVEGSVQVDTTQGSKSTPLTFADIKAQSKNIHFLKWTFT